MFKTWLLPWFTKLNIKLMITFFQPATLEINQSISYLYSPSEKLFLWWAEMLSGEPRVCTSPRGCFVNHGQLLCYKWTPGLFSISWQLNRGAVARENRRRRKVDAIWHPSSDPFICSAAPLPPRQWGGAADLSPAATRTISFTLGPDTTYSSHRTRSSQGPRERDPQAERLKETLERLAKEVHLLKKCCSFTFVLSHVLIVAGRWTEQILNFPDPAHRTPQLPDCCRRHHVSSLSVINTISIVSSGLQPWGQYSAAWFCAAHTLLYKMLSTLANNYIVIRACLS